MIRGTKAQCEAAANIFATIGFAMIQSVTGHAVDPATPSHADWVAWIDAADWTAPIPSGPLILRGHDPRFPNQGWTVTADLPDDAPPDVDMSTWGAWKTPEPGDPGTFEKLFTVARFPHGRDSVVEVRGLGASTLGNYLAQISALARQAAQAVE